jgi:glucan phosphoethanolaminetransferase (alkaline phosphatase superfamily)
MVGSSRLGGDSKAVLLAAAVMFLWALILGVWKYRQMATSETHLAHPYLDTAHRAALLYSFALLLIATFVNLSGWSELVNLLAAGAMAIHFFAAVASYAALARRAETDNQWHDPLPGTHAFMASLILAEIGGWLFCLLR